MDKCAVIILTISLLRATAAMGTDWQKATATWYGPPDGDGSEGGACGYGSSVREKPYSSKVAAGNDLIFKGGKGCGQCYQVKCTDKLCSGQPVTVVITDECPGCASQNVQFDLSGAAVAALSAPGKAAALRNVGRLPVVFKRAPCRYPGYHIAFKVDPGATAYSFSVVAKYVGGDGDVGAMSLMQAGSNVWQPMKHVWGATWALNSGPLKAPFSIRLQSFSTGKTVTAKNVIPEKWHPNEIYNSQINF